MMASALTTARSARVPGIDGRGSAAAAFERRRSASVAVPGQAAAGWTCHPAGTRQVVDGGSDRRIRY